MGYRRKPHPKATYRSGLEDINAERLTDAGIPYQYEPFRISFLQPEKPRTYTPDFLLLNNGILVETKGEFTAADRQKHLLIKEQHPILDIRFVFSNPRARIYKGSPTTMASWADKYGFIWAGKIIPEEWTNEPKNEQLISYLKRIAK